MFNRRIKAGEVFTLKDESMFSRAWMVAVDGKAPKKEEPKAKTEKPKAKTEKKDDVI